MVEQLEQKRRRDLDALKGLSIIAVILYHIGILRSGYLGVDVFFVVSGFLVVPKLLEKIRKDEFKYINFVASRLFRLLPLILIACGICLAFGYFYMLPDDFENLGESVIASVFFSNNILSAITTKNYWDVVNTYKPLMHLWYVGVLAEFYIVVPVILIIENKARKKLNKLNRGGYTLLVITSILSLLLFVLPIQSDANKFYFLPCRFFEMASGGLMGILSKENKRSYSNKTIGNMFLLAIIVLFLVGLIGFDFSQIGAETVIIGETFVDSSLILSNTMLVLLTVGASLGVLLCGSILEKSKVISFIGRRSYSLFVFHQIILAFYRYSVSDKLTVWFLIVYLILIFVLSEFNYRFIEKIKLSKVSGAVSLITVVFLCVVSGLVYIKAGVVRDVPELNIYVSDAHRGMQAEYCDRVYTYDKDFKEENGKINVLIVGNSFARDWGNILLESDYVDKINLSYASDFTPALENRVNSSDCLFVFMDKKDVPDYVWEGERLSGRIWAIGTKSFGSNNGIIYSKRFTSEYFSSVVDLSDGYRKLNDKWHEEWGNKYIDMISPVRNVDSTIRVFTDDNMFISQDCRHLTEAGARYYANRLDIEKYLGLPEDS